MPRRRDCEHSRYDVGGELVLDEADAVAQCELALLQPLDLEDVGSRHHLQRLNRGIEIVMLLPQPLELRFELGRLVFGHSPPPNANRVVACPIAHRKIAEPSLPRKAPWRLPHPGLRSPQSRSAPRATPIRKARMGGRDNSGGELNFGEISIGLGMAIHRIAAAHNRSRIDSVGTSCHTFVVRFISDTRRQYGHTNATFGTRTAASGA